MNCNWSLRRGNERYQNIELLTLSDIHLSYKCVKNVEKVYKWNINYWIHTKMKTIEAKGEIKQPMNCLSKAIYFSFCHNVFKSCLLTHFEASTWICILEELNFHESFIKIINIRLNVFKVICGSVVVCIGTGATYC